jgi:ribosomal protein L32
MEMKKKFLILFVLAALLSLLSLNVVSAQTEPAYSISLQRSFGYGGFGNDIQGYFQIKLKGPLEQAQQVVYTLDGKAMGTVAESPFKLDFNTDDFLPGEHQLGATVKLLDQSEVQARSIRVQILSKGGASKSVFKILIPLFALIIGAAFISSLVAGRTNRAKPGQTQSYNGPYGGAVCPKCGHPFPRSFFGINLGFSRMERCPSCGKWISSRRASAAELTTAEKAELEKYQLASGEKPSQSQTTKPDEKAVEDTRYLDE